MVSEMEASILPNWTISPHTDEDLKLFVFHIIVEPDRYGFFQLTVRFYLVFSETNKERRSQSYYIGER